VQVVGTGRASDAPGNCDLYLRQDLATKVVLDSAASESLEGLLAVVHCAGHAHRSVETAAEIANFWNVNHGGTKRALELAKFAGARRFVYLSSIAFYDWSAAGCFSEEHTLCPHSAYSASKLAGEALCVESGLDYRVARLGTVFGSGDHANFARLAQAIAARRFLLPGRGEARKSVLPSRLAAELVADLALREDIPATIVNLALPRAPSLAEICDAFHRQCGFPEVTSLPRVGFWLGAKAGDCLGKCGCPFPINSSVYEKLSKTTMVGTSRMRALWPTRSWGTFEEWLSLDTAFYRSLVRGSLPQ
jgi:UDP-glucose 4-epimerase